MPYNLDQFTDTDGVPLDAHVMDSGTGWTTRAGAIEIRSNKAATTGSTAAITRATHASIWADTSIQGDFTAPDTGNADIGIVFSYLDEDNRWRAIWQNGGNGFRLIKRIAGVETLVVFGNPPTIVAGTPFTIKVARVGTSITASLTTPAATYTIAATSADLQTATTIGFITRARGTVNALQSTVDNFISWQGAGAQPANPLNPVIVSFPVPFQVVQRNLNNRAFFPITGNIDSPGVPRTIEASWNGGAYRDIATDVRTDFRGLITNLPAGTGTLNVRVKEVPTQASSVASCSIGDVFIIAGQSNASGQGGAPNSSYVSVNGLESGVFGNDYKWRKGTDPIDGNVNQVDAVSSDASATGTYWPLLAGLLIANQNIPVGWIPCPLGGTAIASWLPGANREDRTTLYGSMVYRARQQPNGVRAVLWHQGESDALVNGFTGTAIYKSRLKTLADAIRADLGVKTLCAKVHEWTGAPSTSSANIAAIHLAIDQAAAEDANVVVGPNLNAPFITNSLHFGTTTEMQEVANRWHPFLVSLTGSEAPITPAILEQVLAGQNSIMTRIGANGANLTALASQATAGEIKSKTDALPASPASTADVQPTIDFRPTINPTLTQLQSEQLAQAAALDLGTVPADVTAIRARLAEQVSEPTPVFVLPDVADPAQTLAYGVTRTAGGDAQGGVAVTIALESTQNPGVYGTELHALSSKDPATLGQLTVPLLKSSSYRARRALGQWKNFTTGTGDSFELPTFYDS